MDNSNNTQWCRICWRSIWYQNILPLPLKKLRKSHTCTLWKSRRFCKKMYFGKNTPAIFSAHKPLYIREVNVCEWWGKVQQLQARLQNLLFPSKSHYKPQVMTLIRGCPQMGFSRKKRCQVRTFILMISSITYIVQDDAIWAINKSYSFGGSA